MTGPQRKPASPAEEDEPYAGARLGLPATGTGSLATLLRRFGGVLIDWGVAQLIVWLFFRESFGQAGAASFIPLGVFAAVTIVSLSLTGSTLGHRVMGLQLRQVRPGNPYLQIVIRTVLLCLFFPAILTGRDGRNLHDIAAGTVLVRR